MPPAPQRFGKYQITDRIASGGMAEVYKARLEGIGGFHRTYAIKRILPHLTSNPEFVDMLVDEAKIAGLLSHANIVQILDLGAVDEQYFIAMEFVNGRDLGQVLARCKERGVTLPHSHCVYILIEMLKGLEYAHARTVVRNGEQIALNIIHRDISPGNVLVSFQGEVKLTDFGIAKASVKALETQAGVIKGRFDYMAPEQAAGGNIDQRADLFAAGVLFYESLTGVHPFRQGKELKTLDALRRGAPTPPSALRADIPASLDRIVAKALAVSADQRYQSATAFKDALTEYFHEAGFIFTPGTLGNFVRGLFKAESDGDAKPADVDTGPMARPGPRSLSPAEAAASVARGPTPASLPSPVAIGEESTLIRNPVIEHISPPSQWSEMETVIRPEPGLNRTVPPPVIARPPASERGGVMPRPQTRPDGRIEALRPDLREGPPEGKTRVLYRTSNAVHLGYVMVAFAALIIGLGFGVLLGATRPPTLQLAEAPLVEVQAPVGSRVHIDGKLLPGTLPVRARLSADTPAIIRVERPNAPAIEARITLPANQIRILDFTQP